MAVQQLNSYNDVRNLLNKFVSDSGIDISDSPHQDFWNALDYHDFVNGNVPGVAGPIKILTSGDPAHSNLIAILQGPITGPTGTIEQMPPDGPYMPPDMIASLSDWVQRNCPNPPAAQTLSVQDLMAVDRQARGIGWLKCSLQHAIELEFFTIPPYLCAMWSIKTNTDSIKTNTDPVRGIIFGIVKQEMLHMGLACNLLVAIGGRPKIYYPKFVPDYPSELPGGVRPGLCVGLVGLYRELVRDVFMQIEYPEDGPVPILRAALHRTYATIGEFYDAIQDAFRRLKPRISQDGQLVSKGVQLDKVADLQAACTAIKQIKEQGEGTDQSAFAVDFGNELAHYYQFMQIVVGKYIIKGADGKAHWDDTRTLPFPTDLYPMAAVPKGGYSPDITAVFNQAFTELLRLLDDAWARGWQASLDDAVAAMKGLQKPAVDLMTQPIQDGSGQGNYGPDFRPLSEGRAWSAAFGRRRLAMTAWHGIGRPAAWCTGRRSAAL